MSPRKPGKGLYDWPSAPRTVELQLASYEDRKRHVNAWVEVFGGIKTMSLHHHMGRLNAQLQTWGQTLSASSCNQRRDALTNLVKIQHGKRAALEFIDSVRFERPPATPKWRSRDEIEAVLSLLTDGSKTRARLFLMHWTGMRPSQMARLERSDFHLDTPIPFVQVPRGKGGRLAAVPLPPQGLSAAHAWHRWSCPSANKRIVAAAKRAGIEPFTLYQIRHSFATAPSGNRCRRRGHSEPLWVHRPEDDGDLRRIIIREALRGDRAVVGVIRSWPGWGQNREQSLSVEVVGK